MTQMVSSAGTMAMRGREPEIEFVHVRGREFLLEHELERVGQRLAEAPPGPLRHGEKPEDVDAAERHADAVRPDAVLDRRADPALGHDGVGDEAEDDVDHDENLDER